MISDQNTGLSELDISKINAVFSRNQNIERVILYGSSALGTFKPASDIDLTCIGENISLSQLQEIENELDDFLLQN
jgi:predicted nucleotidyltransferase